MKRKILLFVLLFISCLSFELLFCNSLFIKGESSYVFSLPRIVLYIILFLIEFKLQNKIINNRLKYETQKKKINIIDIFLILVFVFTIIVDIILIVMGRIDIMGQAIIICLLCYIIFLYFFYGNSYKLNILMLCSICFIYSMVVVPQHVLDENTHFISSYNIANFDYNWKNGYVADNGIIKISRFKKYSTNEKLFKHYDKKIIDGTKSKSRPYGICKYVYIPSSIGIFISQYLNGTIMDTFYLGRFFNSLFMLFLIGILLKIVKFQKNIYISIITIPFFILLGSTYSVDAIGTLFILIFTAYVLNIYKSDQEYLTKKNIIIISILMFAILLYKGASYFLIFLLLLLLKKKLPKKYYWVIGLYAVTIPILIYLFMRPGALNTGDVSITGQPDAKEQLKFLFSSPIIFIKVYGLHFIDCFFNMGYYNGFFGTFFYPFVSDYLVIIYVLFLLYIGLDADDIKFTKKEKIMIFIVAMLLFFFTSTGLYLGYTGVGRIHIEGYQARYLFPIVPLLLMLLSNNKIKINKSKNHDMFNYGLILFINIIFILIIVFANIYR